MSSVLTELLAHAPVLTDGAIGTHLLAFCPAGDGPPDALNLSRPAEVERLTRAYVEAGSEIVLTNTFRANPIALEGYGLARKAEEINLAGVEIARRAAASRAAVFASVGPSGKMLAAGEVAEADLKKAFAEQAQFLVAAGVDGFAIETMSDLEEAKVAVVVLGETGRPVVASMVFDSGKNKDRTMTGVTPESAAQELTAAGADVIGANCGYGVAGYISICQRLHASTDRPIWIKPNAGLPEMVEGKVVYRTTPQEFASFVPALLQAGASFIGGCCGTGPDFIRLVGDTLRRWRRR